MNLQFCTYGTVGWQEWCHSRSDNPTRRAGRVYLLELFPLSTCRVTRKLKNPCAGKVYVLELFPLSTCRVTRKLKNPCGWNSILCGPGSTHPLLWHWYTECLSSPFQSFNAQQHLRWKRGKKHQCGWCQAMKQGNSVSWSSLPAAIHMQYYAPIVSEETRDCLGQTLHYFTSDISVDFWRRCECRCSNALCPAGARSVPIVPDCRVP